MTLYDATMRLIGPTEPVGCSNEDARRLKNVQELLELTDRLLGQIERIARNADSNEASVRKIGTEALEFLQGVADAAGEESNG